MPEVIKKGASINTSPAKEVKFEDMQMGFTPGYGRGATRSNSRPN